MNQPAAQPASLPPPPKRLGRYEVVERLGAGGMAEVLLAVRHGAAGFVKAVAIKRILPQFAQNQEFISLLQQEAAIAAMMHHPNCVQVNELEESEGEYFLAMELLFGAPMSSLHKAVRKAGGSFPIGIACRVASDAARGLHYVHGLEDASGNALGIVHRDISPQNLFVTDGGLTKVLDFGIAKAVEGLESNTRTGVLKGKYTFMSPEQVTFRPMDGRSDVWGLAVTLWELLTSKRLFARTGFLEVLEAIKNAPIPPPSVVRPEIPKELDAVILRALERDPDKRTATAGLFAQELDELARTLPNSSYSDTADFVRKHAAASMDHLKSMVSGAAKLRSKRTSLSNEFDLAEMGAGSEPGASRSGQSDAGRVSSASNANARSVSGAAVKTPEPKLPPAPKLPPISKETPSPPATNHTATAVAPTEVVLAKTLESADDVEHLPLVSKKKAKSNQSATEQLEYGDIPETEPVAPPQQSGSRSLPKIAKARSEDNTKSKSLTVEPSRLVSSTVAVRGRPWLIDVAAILVGAVLGLLVYWLVLG